MSILAPTMEAFFSERLISQKQVSDHTLGAYADTFRLLLRFIGAAPESHHPHLTLPMLMPQLLGRSLITLNMSGEMVHGLETPGWRRYIRFSTLPHCVIQSMPD